MQKGVSLAIETIVVVILAVTVLTILLFFFRSQYGETENIVSLINKQTSQCNGYIFYDANCDGEDDRASEVPAGIREGIAEACSGLNRERGDYPACEGQSSASTECIKECCSFFCRR